MNTTVRGEHCVSFAAVSDPLVGLAKMAMDGEGGASPLPEGRTLLRVASLNAEGVCGKQERRKC